MKLRIKRPTSILGQLFFDMGIIVVVVVVMTSLGIWLDFITVTTREIKVEYGPEKTFVVDKESPTYKAFRPITKTEVGPNSYFYYVQEADNSALDERRIILRRKEDGIFFAAKLKNPGAKLQKGQQMKLVLIQYWRSPTVLDEYLVAKP